MDMVAKLMGGTARTRLLRLCMFNPSEVYDKETIAKRIRTTPAVVAREAAALVRAEIIKKKEFTTTIEKNGRAQKRKLQGFQIDTANPLYESLRQFLLETITMSPDQLMRLIRSTGRMRLIVASGFFMHNWEQRLDLLVVGDKIDEDALAQAIRTYEIEAGRELSYACLSTEDFYYRSSIQDRLIRDVFDYPHLVLLDKIDIS